MTRIHTPDCGHVDHCQTCNPDLEPPEPDGEAFRGGEAAAYYAEQQEAARRLK